MLRRLLIFLGVLFVLGSLADAASAAPVLLGSVPIGSNQAVQVAVNSGLNRVYVAGPMGVTGLEVVNVASLSSPTLVTTLPYGGGVTVDPATNHFFSSDAYGGHIVTFNGSTNAAIATTAESGCGGLFDFDPVRNVVDQVTQCIDALNVMNASTFALTGSRSLGGVGGWVAVNSATGDAYAVVNYNQTRVYGPPPGLGLITTLPGEVVAVNPLTNRVYLWPGSGNNLTVYDGATNTPVGTVPGGAGNIGVSCGGIPNYNDGVDTGLNRLYVRNSDCSNLLLVDGASNTVTGTLILPGGNEVRAVTVDSARHLVYVVVGSFSGAKTLYIYSDQAPVPNPNDQLTVQRAEQFIGLGSGETKSVTVSCPSGYEVLDGSPLVQQIDHGLPSFVQIMQSQSTSPGAYTFTLVNPTSGNAQAKGFVTCVLRTTTDGGVITVSDPPLTQAVVFGAGTTTRTLSSPTGATAVDPGYNFTSGSGLVSVSQPTGDLSRWTFAISGGSGNVTLSIRCLSQTTSDGDLLQTQELTKTVSAPPGDSTWQLTCPVGFKGIVASDQLPSGVFLLGHEPQPITRVFTLENTTGTNQTVTLDLLCLSNTTWHTPAPSPVPAAVRLGSSLQVSHGVALVTVRCVTTGRCHGVLSLSTVAGTRVASRSISIRGRHTTHVQLGLDSAGRKAIAQRHAHWLKIAFQGENGVRISGVLHIQRSP